MLEPVLTAEIYKNLYDEHELTVDVTRFDLYEKRSILQASIVVVTFDITVDYRQLVIRKDW